MQLKFSGKQELYVEVAQKYENYIKLGIMKNGDKLPSIRIAANEFGINPNTMARAYSYLEEKGFLQTIPKKGVYVSYTGDEHIEEDVTSKEINECRAAVEQLKNNGVTYEQILKIVEEVYNID